MTCDSYATGHMNYLDICDCLTWGLDTKYTFMIVKHTAILVLSDDLKGNIIHLLANTHNIYIYNSADNLAINQKKTLYIGI
jgi:hypothetical protein